MRCELESIWETAAGAGSRHYPIIRLEVLSGTVKNLGQNDRYISWDSNCEPKQKKSKAITVTGRGGL
jgi:hypothetical protein